MRLIEAMSRIVFMCGPAGSGKSTVAKQLERAGMARLSFDEESFTRGITEHPLSEATHAEIERELLQRLFQLIRQGKDVVLDYSFWSRAMRERYKAILTPLGITPAIYYVVTPKAVALQRIRQRTGAGADDMQLSAETAARYYANFEAPTADEGQITIIHGQGETDATPDPINTGCDL
jgi:predicted kinase